VELAAAFDAASSGGVIVAAIAAVFTIGYVANRLAEDEDWLYELSIDMFPENGCLRVYGVGEDGVTALHQGRHRVPAADRHGGIAEPRRPAVCGQ
jgi:hypothetical protein